MLCLWKVLYSRSCATVVAGAETDESHSVTGTQAIGVRGEREG